ncbi:Pkinase-domain-containing protein [Coemansia reversa NRRL 1564]|uniref:non-specific serine/threonine protein kinase n=1 Tax=Coemansia reversa (strain ATCC 12441 / NRRL 1564) TaxID=763665 RepID=A0A2G5BBN3_COERN|nr:Pkinase-domain-containing protein [Coemansia reversa NRRL 1564]|eukprot:PIA16411.1 Pkinase-domain-containing protein [Coemansia reversa NRRL 1564]
MTADSLEMRERPQIPPKPANLRLNNIPTVPSHTALVAADAVNALNTASESPARSLQSASRALEAAAATPKISPSVLPQQHKGQDGADGHVPTLPSSMSSTKPSMQASASKQAAARRRAVSDFEFGETLGEGSYSTVVEATEKATGRVFAAKILDKRHIIKEKKTKYVNIERDILQALNHPFIVRLHYAFQDSQSLYFIIDMASNGELLTWIRKLGGLAEECARFYLAEIITAVEYMHAERTLHRDIKPENILLGNDMHILVTDFGTAKMFRKGEPDQRAYSFVGTAEYVSPELLTDKAADRNSDLWAVGCIAYQLFTGRPPFKGSNEYQTFQKILKLDYTLPLAMPPQARDLVERILVLDPEKRLGATQCGGIEALKSHSFFHGFEWRDLLSRTPPQMAGPTTVSGEPRKVPPAIPPKPVLLRQQPAFSGGGEDVRAGLYDTHGSSSDGFGTEKGSDGSFSATPSASTDPFAGYNPPNLSNYQIDPPISPLQAPVHVSSHTRGEMAQRASPPPVPPSSLLWQQQQQQYYTPPDTETRPIVPYPAYMHVSSQSTEASEIYNVRLNDHVPAPLKAEEMAEVENYHRTNGRHPQPMSPSTTDYYANMSYRPPGQPVHSVYNTNNFGRTGRDTMGGIGSANGNSWTSRLKSVLCCGG